MRASDPLPWGSSPLTRGKPKDPAKVRFARGLIPAHAGKTNSVDGFKVVKWAHPRSRGENHGAVLG